MTFKRAAEKDQLCECPIIDNHNQIKFICENRRHDLEIHAEISMDVIVPATCTLSGEAHRAIRADPPT